MNKFYTAKRDIMVYKKVQTSRGRSYILQCLLPKGTKCFGKRTGGKSEHERKQRAKFLVPLAFYESESNNHISKISNIVLSKRQSVRHMGFYGARSKRYTLGEKAEPHYFSADSTQCSGGIHFFYRVNDALEWY